ncbi:MAG: conjugal transfer protein TrbI, partial [Mesorhizobium sp.]|nr:conjugal transfer protein TrbI [Mesorhizobium sp.]
IIVVNPDGSTTSIQGNGTQQDARTIAAETIAAGIQQMANEAFKTSNATRPTIHIPQGTDINVFVTRDLDFSELYPDPVREEFERIRAARRSRK